MTDYSALDYLKIDIANHFGMDKELFPVRINWVDFNRIDDLIILTGTADKPYQYLAAVHAYDDAIKGIPTGHLVGLDACASGIAIMGLMMGCETTLRNCGLIGDERRDMYQECTKQMIVELQSDIDIPRSDVKSAQMTHFFGSKKEPKLIFGEDTPELQAFYDAQYVVATGACILMEELLLSWQPYALSHSCTLVDNFHIEIPVIQKMETKIEIDELEHASIKYMYDDNIGTEKGVSIAANVTHGIDGFVVREMKRRCSYNELKLHNILRLIESYADVPQIHPTHFMEVLSNKHDFLTIAVVNSNYMNEGTILEFSPEYRKRVQDLIYTILAYREFDIVFIHDEFKSHPNHMNKLREHYNAIMVGLVQSKTMIQQIIREVRNDDTYTIERLSNNLGSLVAESEYFLS